MKIIETRVSQKHDFESRWNLTSGFIPHEGEIIVYDAETDGDGNVFAEAYMSGSSTNFTDLRTDPIPYARIKIGDGVTDVKNLEFSSSGSSGGGTSNSLTGVSVAGKAVNVSNGVAAIPTATTSVYGATKLSTAVDSDATDVAATPSAVKKAYDMAETGGKYGQHCWLVETYTKVEESVVETKLIEDVTLCTATSGISDVIAYSTEVSEGALVNPTKVTIVGTYGYISSTGSICYNYQINNSIAQFESLLTTLNTLSKTEPGVYLQVNNGEIYRVYNDTDSVNVKLVGFTSVYDNSNSTTYYTALKVLGGSVTDTSNGNTFDAKTYTIFTSPGYTKFLDSSIVYSVRKEDFTEGDDSNGHIYTYLNVPSETLPLETKFTQHCWRKQGYKFEIGGNENISYKPVSGESGIVGGYTDSNTNEVISGTKFGMANSITLTDDGKWIPDSASVEYAEVGRFGTYYQTADQYNTDLKHLYYGFSILGYYWGVAPGFSSPLEWVSDTTFSQYLSQRLYENDGVVYISLDATSKDDWTEGRIYRITNSSQLSLGSETFDTGVSMDPDSSTVTYYSIYFNGAQLCSETPESDKDYDSTYEGIDEIIYTPVENAFEPGDNEQGLIYTYYGIPAYSWFTNKTGSTSSSAKIATGSYMGSGATNLDRKPTDPVTNSITCNFDPKMIYIEGVKLSGAEAETIYRANIFSWMLIGAYTSGNMLYTAVSGSTMNVLSTHGYNQAKKEGNTVTWYSYGSTDPAVQMNRSDIVYKWIAIG